MTKPKSIMFLGTGSDVGKSIVTTAFCRIFKRKGFRVAPFKAQNMSNNSYVTLEGGEIGRAQVVQAEAAGLIPTVHMNPILLKPSTEMGAQIVLKGHVFGQMNTVDYRDLKLRLKQTVMESYHHLASEYDLIVMEGAGSCCEMNLKQNDLVNLPMAKAAGANCILVADIDRGGVFAQIIGTYNLMTRKEKDMCAGFLINKFRGDPKLFLPGIEYIEKKTRKPVLGLVPYYYDILIDSEDSVAIQTDKRAHESLGRKSVNIAVLRLPAVSNFTDLESLIHETDVKVNYLTRPQELSFEYDGLIIPGTKNVMEDAVWLGKTGWKKSIRVFAERKRVLGVCGGYQLLGEKISDPHGVESNRKKVNGLGLLPVETILEGEKIVRRVTGVCLLNGKRLKGYEIHMGKTAVLRDAGAPFLKINEPGKRKKWEDGYTVNKGRVAGTYVHGILDSPGFRSEFLNDMRREKGLKARKSRRGRQARFHEYERLADHFEKYCDVDRILSVITD